MKTHIDSEGYKRRHIVVKGKRTTEYLGKASNWDLVKESGKRFFSWCWNLIKGFMWYVNGRINKG